MGNSQTREWILDASEARGFKDLLRYVEVSREFDRIKGQIQRSGYCGKWGWFNSKTGDTGRFFCGSRKCTRAKCKSIYHWKRVRLLDALVREYGLNWFFTLTLDPKLDGGECPWDRIAHVWSKFRHRMKRRTDGLKYVAVLEAHKNGRPHIHGFWDRFMSWEVVREQWEASGAGKGVWLEHVKTSDVAQYVSKQLDVAKYVGKEQLVGVPEKVRRTLWRSSHLKAEYEVKRGDLTNESEWCIIKHNLYGEDDQIRKELDYGKLGLEPPRCEVREASYEEGNGTSTSHMEGQETTHLSTRNEGEEFTETKGARKRSDT